MPRTARLVIPHLPYHITHRGNNREQICYYDTEYFPSTNSTDASLPKRRISQTLMAFFAK